MIISIIASTGLFLYNYPDINVLYYWCLNLSSLYIIILELPQIQEVLALSSDRRKRVVKQEKMNPITGFAYEYAVLIMLMISVFLGSILFINLLTQAIDLYSVVISVKSEVWIFSVAGATYSFNNAVLMNILSAIFLIGVGEEILRALIIKTCWHFIGGVRETIVIPKDIGRVDFLLIMFSPTVLAQKSVFKKETPVKNQRLIIADWLALILSTAVWVIWHMFLHYNPYFIIALLITGLFTFFLLRFQRDRYGHADLFIPMLAHSITDVTLMLVFLT